jgi:hypothetical protein
LKDKIEKKNQFSKKTKKIKRIRIKVDIKNKNKIFDWRVELKRIITFNKWLRKKIKIKTMRTKLENIIPSIWIERWNWKPIKLLQKGQRKQNRNTKNEEQIEEYNIW